MLDGFMTLCWHSNGPCKWLKTRWEALEREQVCGGSDKELAGWWRAEWPLHWGASVEKSLDAARTSARATKGYRLPKDVSR
jgi:hypothetical protein